jgi:predicted phage tail protein
VFGGFAAVAGGLLQLVAWVAAVVKTNRMTDKTWFTVLLLGGLVAVILAPVGFAVMLAHVLAGPDGMVAGPPQPAVPVSRPTTLVPTS